MALTGPDCSRHQGTVVWSAVRSAGHSFAIIKATEGTGYTYVGWYHDNAARVRAAGLTLGAYAFLRTGDGAAEARYYVSVVGDFDGVLAVLDVETAANGSQPTISDVREFANEFRRLVPGHPLILYTGRWYWVGVLGDPYGADIGPLWHSEYDGSTPFAADVANGPELDNYGGWPGAVVWQHTSTGLCPGVSGNCDLNIFYGTATDLAVLANATEDDDMQADERAALFAIKGLLEGTSGDRIGDLWNRDGDTLANTAAIRANLEGVTGDRIGDLWNLLGLVLAETGVDEAQLAQHVLGALTPEAIAAAIPDTIASDVADELHARLAG